MKRKKTQYAEHPRYGYEPRMTGLDIDTNKNKKSSVVHLHWFSTAETRIKGTAILANRHKQVDDFFRFTHYYDEKRQCEDCQKPFIFYAQEQKYWYEVLRFPSVADCICCVACRKKRRAISWYHRRYGELSQLNKRSSEENIEMAACGLFLIEKKFFGDRVIQRMRMLLNSISKTPNPRLSPRLKKQYLQLRERVRTV